MRITLNLIILAAFAAWVAAAAGAEASKKAPLPPQVDYNAEYVLGPDSQESPEIPQGELREFLLEDSKAFPGFQRSWWLYIPRQYRADRPAALMFFNDGGGFRKRDGVWRVPVVLDNLIAKKDIPVMVAVFVNPGDTPLAPGEKPRERPDGRSLLPKNRGREYDVLGDRFARLLIEEMLPLVRLQVNITDNPAGRGIAGSSSGGICAFTVAWERPDQFSKVFSAVGSFVRQGAAYPDLIRTHERKPLRVFLQDGENDQVLEYGSWPEANKAMAAALKASGYDLQFAFGRGSHNPRHGASIFPDAMRWLWRDYPRE